MGILAVCLILLTASAMPQHQRYAPHSIHRACCDRAHAGWPLLVLRSPLAVQALEAGDGFPNDGSKRDVRRNRSLSGLELQDRSRSTRIVCSRKLVLERQSSVHESCIRHWEAASAGLLYCRFVLSVLLLLRQGILEPPSAATANATNGCCSPQHVILQRQLGSWAQSA